MKKSTFCQSGATECLVKTILKVKMTRNSFNKRVRFWSISRDVKKMTKIGHFKAKLIPKMTLFGDQKKRHLFEVFQGGGGGAGRMRVTFFSHSRILRTHSGRAQKSLFARLNFLLCALKMSNISLLRRRRCSQNLHRDKIAILRPAGRPAVPKR